MIAWGLLFSLPFAVPLVAALANLNYLVFRLAMTEEFGYAWDELPDFAIFDRVEAFCYRWFVCWVAYAVGMLAALGALS